MVIKLMRYLIFHVEQRLKEAIFCEAPTNSNRLVVVVSTLMVTQNTQSISQFNNVCSFKAFSLLNMLKPPSKIICNLTSTYGR